jgi:GT2 family glycosyltransferase
MKQTPPIFSIVIPTYNRPRQLMGCLQALTGLCCPRDSFEVIVVDDGGTIRLEDQIAPFRGELNIELIRQNNSGPASARNRGAAEATGDFLAFTDDDCAPLPNWLQALADVFQHFPDCGLGGKTVNALTDNVFSTTSQLLLDYLYDYFNQEALGPKFFASNNLAFPRKAFLESGGFDIRYQRAAAEDRELCDRWLSQGRHLQYVPEAVVSHAHSLSLKALWRQHFTYGRGAFAFHRMRAERGGGPVKVEPVSFYLNMVLYPFTYASFKRAIPISMLLIMAQAANAGGYFWEKVKNQRDAIKMPLWCFWEGG